MATITVGGFNPFGKHAKTLEDAVNMAMNGDTISIKKSRVDLLHGALINKTLYIEGNNTIIHVPDNHTGFKLTNGDFSLTGVNFNLDMQNNGIIIDPSYAGTVTLTHVNFEHTKNNRRRFREIYQSLLAVPPQEGGSGCQLVLNDCNIDALSVNVRSVTLNHCNLGRLYRVQSSVLANNLTIKNLLTANNVYFSCGNNCHIAQLTTDGQVVFRGNFDVAAATVSTHGIDRGGNKFVTGHAARKLYEETLNADSSLGQIDTIFTGLGTKKYPTELAFSNLTLEQTQEAPFYSRSWFSMDNSELTVRNTTIPKLEYQSQAQNGTIALENVQDNSNWIIKDVTLSNKLSHSQLFDKANTDNKLETADRNSENFGALHELNSMIGLTEVKKQLADMVNTAKVDTLMREKGVQVKDDENLSMVLAGNPGTGKTAVARLYGQAMYETGVLKTNKFTEVQSGDLIGEHVGETQPKTRAVVERALDGVLFIDEAYTLAHEQGGNTFKDEAVAELLKDMYDHKDRLVVILAGYTGNMRHFFDVSNPGLKSRFPNWINFPDYTPKEMLEILNFDINKKGFHLADQATALELRNRVLKQLQFCDINSGNGRFIENCLDKISRAKNTRIANTPGNQNMDKVQLMTITKSDVDLGMNQVAKQQSDMGGL